MDKLDRCLRPRKPKHRSVGNAVSLSASRPLKYIEAARIFDIGLNRAISQNHIVDTLVEPRTTNYPEKNHLTQSICLKYNRTNTQGPTAFYRDSWISKTPKVPTAEPMRLIELPRIRPHLWLGDRHSVSHFIESHKHVTIIDLCGRVANAPTCPGGQQYKVHHVPYHDTKYIARNVFVTTVRQVCSLIDATHGPLLIVCDKGVNRAASMAIAYGIVREMGSYEILTRYVDDAKVRVSPTWNHLTNHRIRNLLGSLRPGFI